MNNFHDYDDFLNEKIEIPLLVGCNDFISGIVKYAKTRKLIIKSSKDRDAEGWLKAQHFTKILSNDYRNHSKVRNSKNVLLVADNHPDWVVTRAYHYIEISVLTGHEPFYVNDVKYLDPAYVLIVSREKIVEKEVLDIFDEEIQGFLQKTTYTWKRSVDRAPFVDNLIHGAHMMILKYEMITSVREKAISVEDLKKLPAYIELINVHPVKLISTAIQLKRPTLVFAYPKEYVIDINNTSDWITDSSPWFHVAYGLSERGYVRKYPTYQRVDVSSWHKDQPNMISKFNSTTIEGWNDGLKTIKILFDKLIKRMKKSDVIILHSKEELHKKRGYITGRRFNL